MNKIVNKTIGIVFLIIQIFLIILWTYIDFLRDTPPPWIPFYPFGAMIGNIINVIIFGGSIYLIQKLKDKFNLHSGLKSRFFRWINVDTNE